MPKPGISYEIDGIGDLDYGGVLLKTVDKLVEKIAKEIVQPDVQARINDITHETERSIKVKREGFFDPRKGHKGVAPTWSVYADPDDIEHAVFLEYGSGGKYSFLRKAAKNRQVKAQIRALVNTFFNREMKTSIRHAKRRKKKTSG